MTYGEVLYDRTATVPVTVHGRNGASDITIVAVIDTGFDGFLSLPSALIAQLQLDFVGRRESAQFGGEIAEFDIYLAAVEFAGEGRGVVAFAAENPPLVGMSLLYGLKMTMETVDGGELMITRLPHEPIGDVG